MEEKCTEVNVEVETWRAPWTLSPLPRTGIPPPGPRLLTRLSASGLSRYTRQCTQRCDSPLCPTAHLTTPRLFVIVLSARTAFAVMSHSRAAPSESSSSNFQLILDNALKAYKKRTKKDLLIHPLASQLQACEFPADIVAVLQQQIQGLDQSRSSDERWTKWLDPTINILLTFSQTVGTVGLV
jgi:hypothetical protein